MQRRGKSRHCHSISNNGGVLTKKCRSTGLTGEVEDCWCVACICAIADVSNFPAYNRGCKRTWDNMLRESRLLFRRWPRRNMLEHILMGRYQVKNIENSRPILMESTGLAMDHQCCSRSRKYKSPQYSSVQVRRSSLEVFEQPLLTMMKNITRHEYL
jgi:hypothetical protein